LSVKNTLLKFDREMKDAYGLTYHSAGLGYMNTKELRANCLKGVEAEVYADSFESCEGKAMEDVCTFAKRGWLKEDVSKKTSDPNTAFLQESFTGLAGGLDAVNKCLKVKEEVADVDEDYYYEVYDYSEYFDAYDYLEEKSELTRARRGAGENECKNCKKGDKKCKKQCKKQRKNGKKGNEGTGENECKKKCKGDKKCKQECKNKRKGNRKNKTGKTGEKECKNNCQKGDKKCKNDCKKPGKKAKKASKKNNDQKTADRKYTNIKPEDNDKNEKKIEKRLAELGLKVLPPKSTLDALICLEDAIEQLFTDCGERKLSQS